MNICSYPYIWLHRNVLCNCDIEAERNFLLESLATCDEHKKPDLEMYFMVNLAFMDYLVQLNVTLNTPIDRNWMSVKQPIPISLDSFQINPKLMHPPIMLKDFMEQYWENTMTITKQENPKSKFQKFINSFLVDTLIFIAAILTVILALVIIYILTGQSKLKVLISNIASQRIKAVEAPNTDKPVQNCNSGILKILMILNLVIVVSLLLRKIKKSILFQGQPFSNMVKVKLFLANTKSLCLAKLESIIQKYTSIQTNGWSITKRCHPKEKLDMECVRSKIGKHPHNPKQQRNTSTHYTPSTTHSQNKGQETIWQNKLNAHLHHAKTKKILVQSRMWMGITFNSEAYP